MKAERGSDTDVSRVIPHQNESDNLFNAGSFQQTLFEKEAALPTTLVTQGWRLFPPAELEPGQLRDHRFGGQQATPKQWLGTV